MAWTASVKSVDKQPSLILVTVEYSDGVTTLEESYKLYGPPDADWLKRTAQTTIDRLTALAETTIPVGAISPYTWIPEAALEGGYLFQTGFVALAQNKVFFNIFNAPGSGRFVRIHSVRMQKNFASVTGVPFQLNLYYTSTLGSGGITPTIIKTNPNLLNLPSQIGIQCFPTTLPTASTLIYSRFHHSEETNAAASIEERDGIWPIVAPTLRASGPIVLSEGIGAGLLQVTATTAGTYNCVVFFTIE